MKNIRKALAQGHGTIRLLQPKPATLKNRRGRPVEIDAGKLKWITVAVVDHPDPPEDTVLDGCVAAADLVLLRRDWEFLFDQLKSIHAVAEYFARVAGDPVKLGREAVRYFELAQADANAKPDPPRVDIGADAVHVNEPLLPTMPAAEEDRLAHTVFRVVLEDIAISPLEGVDETDRLWVLGELDRSPVQGRGELGRFMMEALGQVVQRPGPDEVEWRFRRVLSSRHNAQLAFGACSRFSPEIRNAFQSWVQLRHHDVTEMSGVRYGMTEGVLVTPRGSGPHWDTTMTAVQGALKLSDDDLALYRRVWDDADR